jgi:hypothetical protein
MDAKETDPNKMSVGRLSNHIVDLANRAHADFNKETWDDYWAAHDIWDKKYVGRYYDRSDVDRYHRRMRKAHRIIDEAVRLFDASLEAGLDQLHDGIMALTEPSAEQLDRVRQTFANWHQKYGWRVDEFHSRPLRLLEIESFLAQHRLVPEPNDDHDDSTIVDEQ